MKKTIAFLMVVMLFACSIMPSRVEIEAEAKAIPQKTYISKDGKSSYTVSLVDEKSIQAYADAPMFTTVDEAAAYLREGMKKREASVQLMLYIDNPTEVYESVYYEILDKIFEHTGNPTEGDYLHSVYTSNQTGIKIISGKFIQYSFEIEYKTSASQEEQLDGEVEKLLTSLGVENMNDYQKVNAIYSYMCKNIKYDYTSTSDLKYTAYAALINKTSVCQGYATLLYRLLLEVGMDARMIRGESHNERHAWNIVNLKGKYYNLDATWDSNGDRRAYFLKCNNNFDDHSRDAEFATVQFNSAYPMASSDYIYNASEDAPTVTAKPKNTPTPVPTDLKTPMPTVAATPTPEATPVDKTKPYIYFEPASLTLGVGEVADVTMYFGGGNEYACNEILLNYTLPGDNCKITSLLLDFGNGIEKIRVTAQREGTLVFTRTLLNRNRELLGTAKLVIKVVNAPTNTATPTVKPTPTVTLIPTPTATPTPKPQDTNSEQLKGDVNGDGKVNSRDIAVIQKHLTGMSIIVDAKVLDAADYNEDSKINSRDIAAINKMLLGR